MNTPSSQTDRIERSIVLHAPRARVWRALTDAQEFGAWFGAHLDGQTFAPGQRARGRISISGYEHVWFDVVVERIEPQDLFAFHWHPYAIDPAVDYAAEPPTLVTFTLAGAPDHGTLLTVVESGFDRVPPQRRFEAFRMNDRGWQAQLRNIERHVAAV